jgi:hypothetical protein
LTITQKSLSSSFEACETKLLLFRIGKLFFF